MDIWRHTNTDIKYTCFVEPHKIDFYLILISESPLAFYKDSSI